MSALVFGWVVAAAEPLQLEEVRASLDERVPDLAEAEAKREEALGKELAARGAFDPKLGGKAKTYTGKDPRTLTTALVGGETLPGIDWSAGWTRGTGSFPTYADGETGAEGSFVASLDVPLLDGLWFGESRVAREVATAQVDLAERSLDAKRVAARRKASEAWAKWVAAGLSLEVDLELLELAERRGRALAREIEEGSRAPVDRLDNDRVVWERTERVAEGRAKLEVAALELGLWLRDEQGRPMPPGPERLPDDLGPALPLGDVGEDAGLVATRPDVAAVEAATDAAIAEQAGARNDLWPSLDLGAGVEAPLDPDAKTEWVAGMSLEVPTLWRKERGKLAAARARVDGLGELRRGLVDAASAEVSAARARHDGAAARVEAARSAAELALQLAELEGRRFELGDADLFSLWQREEVAGRARKTAIDAELALRLSELEVEAARGVLDRPTP